MNTHFQHFLQRSKLDHRLKPVHISMYHVLHTVAPDPKYGISFQLPKSETMALTRIISKPTYFKCLTQLHEFGYIVYKPSFHPKIGSLVELRFLNIPSKDDVSQVLVENNQTKLLEAKKVIDNSIKETLPKDNQHISVHLSKYLQDNKHFDQLKSETCKDDKPPIPLDQSKSKTTLGVSNQTADSLITHADKGNSANKGISVTHQNQSNTFSASTLYIDNNRSNNNSSINTSNSNINGTSKKNEPVKEDLFHEGSKFFSTVPPTLEMVTMFFAHRGYPKKDAEMFYNYYQSNGWKMGGKIAVNNWRGIALNWMLRTPVFNQQSSFKSKGDYVHVKNNSTKNYAEPL